MNELTILFYESSIQGSPGIFWRFIWQRLNSTLQDFKNHTNYNPQVGNHDMSKMRLFQQSALSNPYSDHKKISPKYVIVSAQGRT